MLGEVLQKYVSTLLDICFEICIRSEILCLFTYLHIYKANQISVYIFYDQNFKKMFA